MGRFVKARLIQGWLVVVPVAAAIIMVSTALIPQTTIISLLSNTVLGVLIAAANVTIVLGLFLLIPAFSEKSLNFMVNFLIIIFISIVLFMGPLFGLMRMFPGLEPDVRSLQVLLSQNVLSWLMGIVFLYLGKRNLSRIE